MARRSKKSLKRRPKYKQDLSLKNRRKKNKLNARRRRARGKIKAGRVRRGTLKR